MFNESTKSLMRLLSKNSIMHGTFCISRTYYIKASFYKTKKGSRFDASYIAAKQMAAISIPSKWRLKTHLQSIVCKEPT